MAQPAPAQDHFRTALVAAVALGLVLGVAAGRYSGAPARGAAEDMAETTFGRDSLAVRQARELNGQLDAVEAELTHARSLVALHEELARRHERVSALACESALEHLESSQRLCGVAAARAVHGRRFAAAPAAAPTR